MTETAAKALPKTGRAAQRDSNLELLRILCMFFIVADHFSGQSLAAETASTATICFYAVLKCGSRVGCSVFVMISAWFMCDGSFKMERVLRLWLTTLCYTVPLTLLCLFLPGVEVGWRDVVNAFLPVSGTPLWFTAYFILMSFASPFLNLLLRRLSQKQLRWILGGVAVPLVVYPTLTANIGIFQSDIVTMLFIYLLTGYLKRYPVAVTGRRGLLLGVMLGGQAVLTAWRAISMIYGAGGAFRYVEMYRSQFRTLPNLVIALAAFYWFKGLAMPRSRVINGLSATMLGVYVFHQVPCFSAFLWNGIFHTETYNGDPRQMAYSLFVVAATFMAGVVIELLRLRVVQPRVERMRIYRMAADKGDEIVGGIVRAVEEVKR